VTRRLPSTPPALPGFTYIRVLGSGGFADVFLYEQNYPRRQVAVKVILGELVNDQVRHMVRAEANLMAQLSGHPSILTVYQASVSADGRPYLVMELCSASLSQRYRNDSLAVSEVLAIAIKIGSAIESAHRMGVLHRDIKPSNILTTTYGHPVLSDFGIAATLRESDRQEAVGMSIPWSAPEVLMDETAGTILSEVWSFAATVYSLLAGRSPFEVLGKSNSSSDLISRINRAKVSPSGRPDAPPSLERALAKAMARQPQARTTTVIELIYELQAVESELGLPQTTIDLAMDEWANATTSEPQDRTEIRGFAGGGAPRGGSANARRRTRRATETGVRQQAISSPDLHRSARVSGEKTTVAIRRSHRLLPWAIAVVSILVVALVVTATTLIVRSASAGIPTVVNISAEQSATSVEFRWPDPGITTDDSYQVIVDGDGVSIQSQSSFVVDARHGDVVCVSVRVVRAGQLGEPSNPQCVEFAGP